MKSELQIKAQQKEQLYKLTEWVGSQRRLADELGVSKQTVHNWIKRGRISAVCATLVQEKTDGLFKRDDLRPDVIVWRIK